MAVEMVYGNQGGRIANLLAARHAATEPHTETPEENKRKIDALLTYYLGPLLKMCMHNHKHPPFNGICDSYTAYFHPLMVAETGISSLLICTATSKFFDMFSRQQRIRGITPDDWNRQYPIVLEKSWILSSMTADFFSQLFFLMGVGFDTVRINYFFDQLRMSEPADAYFNFNEQAVAYHRPYLEWLHPGQFNELDLSGQNYVEKEMAMDPYEQLKRRCLNS